MMGPRVVSGVSKKPSGKMPGKDMSMMGKMSGMKPTPKGKWVDTKVSIAMDSTSYVGPLSGVKMFGQVVAGMGGKVR